MDVLLSLPWSESTQKLKLIVPVVVFDQKIDVNSNIIHCLNVYLFKLVKKASLIDVLLKRMEVNVQSLVLTHDWTPKVYNFIHWILFPSCKTNCFLKNKWKVLQELLTVVAGCEKLWNLWSAPDYKCFVGPLLLLFVVVHVLLVIDLSKLKKCFSESFSFKTVCGNND